MQVGREVFFMAVKDNTATGLLEGDLNDTEEHRRAVYALFKAGDARFDGACSWACRRRACTVGPCAA